MPNSPVEERFSLVTGHVVLGLVVVVCLAALVLALLVALDSSSNDSPQPGLAPRPPDYARDFSRRP
jgi:hypothetical protein